MLVVRRQVQGEAVTAYRWICLFHMLQRGSSGESGPEEGQR